MLKKKKTTASGEPVMVQSVRRTRSHRMKFCVQKGGLGGAALNKQTAGNVSVYEHSHCLPDLCVAIHTHCLPVISEQKSTGTENGA